MKLAQGVTIELQKKELKAKIQSGSLVARRALSQWNKLNATIRGVVSGMKVSNLFAISLSSWLCHCLFHVFRGA